MKGTVRGDGRWWRSGRIGSQVNHDHLCSVGRLSDGRWNGVAASVRLRGHAFSTERRPDDVAGDIVERTLRLEA